MMVTYKKESNEVYHCKLCDFTTGERKTYRQHLKEHSDKGDTRKAIVA